MTILLLLVPISVLLLGAAVAAFAWAVRTGQFDDLDTPAVAMLVETDDSIAACDGDAAAGKRRVGSAPSAAARAAADSGDCPRASRLRSAGSGGAWDWSWPIARARRGRELAQGDGDAD
ncbi:cbb3-type cytochrome oxidase maturation protein [Tahibacter aquaticus]|uniref:Cbb3-type cytochrome oxidase maturation protein n=1 Tax=Tahibacter aquaticus TaxID=520092 RepID=A0A4R6YQ25_9GAMM|nr:cbb3-type cytochrome oxidase assembly protein CcoS [Tahibacter aquaticus]TDR39975.1 cbb3-type cytochrome oxidase maturation protein [Tahibacter aquaticus]